MIGSCTLPAKREIVADARITVTERELEIMVQRRLAQETRIFVQQLEDWSQRNRFLGRRLVESELRSAAFEPVLKRAFALLDANDARLAELTAEIARLTRQYGAGLLSGARNVVRRFAAGKA